MLLLGIDVGGTKIATALGRATGEVIASRRRPTEASGDASADLDKARDIITNAKTRRVSVCNALDTLVIHRELLPELPGLLQELGETHQAAVHADPESLAILPLSVSSTDLAAMLICPALPLPDALVLMDPPLTISELLSAALALTLIVPPAPLPLV